MLGVIGDFDTAAMKLELQDVLGGWQAATGQPSEPPKVRPMCFWWLAGRNRPTLEGALSKVRPQNPQRCAQAGSPYDLLWACKARDTLALHAAL